MDKRQPGGDLEREIHARAAERRALRSVDPADILKQGYKPEEVQSVILFRKKRDEWRKMGSRDEIDVLVNNELQAWMARYHKSVGIADFERDKETRAIPEGHASLFRAIRAFIGSSLEGDEAEVKVKFMDTFDLPGEFSVEKKFIPHMGTLIEKKLKGASSAPSA